MYDYYIHYRIAKPKNVYNGKFEYITACKESFSISRHALMTKYIQ